MTKTKEAIEALDKLEKYYLDDGEPKRCSDTIRTALTNAPEVINYWDFEDEMEDVTNRDNGKTVSAFLMKRFPNGLIVKGE